MKTFLVKASWYDRYYDEQHEAYHTVCAETDDKAELKAETHLNSLNRNNPDLSSVCCYAKHEITSHIGIDR